MLYFVCRTCDGCVETLVFCMSAVKSLRMKTLLNFPLIESTSVTQNIASDSHPAHIRHAKHNIWRLCALRAAASNACSLLRTPSPRDLPASPRSAYKNCG